MFLLIKCGFKAIIMVYVCYHIGMNETITFNYLISIWCELTVSNP